MLSLSSHTCVQHRPGGGFLRFCRQSFTLLYLVSLALLVLGQSQPPSLFLLLSMSVLQDASAGNRTRVTSMATMYSTTRPLMLLLCAADACLVAQACLEYPSLALLPPVSCPSVLQLRPPHLLLRAPASLLLLHAAPCILLLRSAPTLDAVS